MSHEAKNRLGWAFVVGCLIALPFVAWTGNFWFFGAGSVASVLAELADLAWDARVKRLRR